MSSEKYLIDLSDYELSYSIGSGGFSQVYMIKEKSTGEEYAAKISKFMVDEDLQDSNQNNIFLREVKLMTLMNYPSILKFYGYSQKNFNNEPFPTIVTELAINGSLLGIIESENSGLSPDDWNATKKLINIYGIAIGMSYLHAQKILHRDLKSANILLDSNFYPKIADFGLSKLSDILSKSMNFKTQSGIKGTPVYMAPEIISEEKYSTSSDVYAFGFIVYEIMCVTIPFAGYNCFQLMKEIQMGKRPPIQEDVPSAYRELIEQCWSQDPKNRPSFDEIVNQLRNNPEFITNLIDELEFSDYIESFENDDLKNDDFNQVNTNYKINNSNEKNDTNDNNSNTNEKINENDEFNDSNAKNDANINNSNINEKINKNNEINNSNEKNYPNFNKKISENSLGNGPHKLHRCNAMICIYGKKVSVDSQTFNETPKIIEKNSETSIEDTLDEFKHLNKKYQELVKESKDDPYKLFYIGKSLIEGENDFPKDTVLGIQYLKKSNSKHCLDSLFYYTLQLIKGKLIPQNLNEAEQYINEFSQYGDKRIFVLQGKFNKKISNFKKAKEYFEEGSKNGSKECMYKYAKMIFLEEGSKNKYKNSIILLTQSKDLGYKKSEYFLKALEIMRNIKGFSSLISETQLFFISHVINTLSKENDQNDQIFERIIINPNETEKLYFNKSFKSSKFHSCLDKFKNISVEIRYPSKPFKSINDIISKIQKKNIMNITIGIVFSSFPITNDTRCFSQNFSYYTIDDSLQIIQNNAFEKCSLLKQIIIPSSITSFEDYSFFECSALTQISIPSSVTSIGDFVFSGCSSLKYISIPSSVTSIGKNSFDGCSSLAEIIIPSTLASIGDYSFSQCSSLTNIIIPSSLTILGDGIFNKCTKLKTIKIPSSVKAIKNNTFNECSSLVEVFIPSSLTSIGENAFSQCTLLEQLSFDDPPSLASIGKYAFYQCISLKQISIPSSVTSIDEYTFTECSSLIQITIPPSITTITSYSFSDCSSLIDITIPSSITSIETGAFSQCFSLQKISIPSSVTSFGNYIFNGVVSLEITGDINHIPDNLFNGCLSLKQISIASSVTSIGKNSFDGCSSLTEIIIPQTVTSIGENSFSQCSSLTNITIPSSLTNLGDGIFNKCTKLTTIIIPSSVISIGNGTFFSCSELTKVLIPSSVTSIGDFTFSECSKLNEILIPSSVISIGSFVFSECSSLNNISIPSSVTSFGDKIFDGIASLEITGNIDHIPDNLFEECIYLKQISFSSPITWIGNKAFKGCKSLMQISIPPSVTSIGKKAFKGCKKLAQISIPSSVCTIKDNAFSSNTKIIRAE